MKKDEAMRICAQFNIPKGDNFHVFNSDIVARIIEAADSRKYRAPKNANGSRARYFYAMLTRALNSKVPEYVPGNYRTMKTLIQLILENDTRAALHKQWDSVTDALEYCKASADPKDTCLKIVAINADMGETGFSSELIHAFL